MRNFSRRFPILTSLILIIVFFLVMRLFGAAAVRLIYDDGSYFIDMITELCAAAVVFVMAFLLGKADIYIKRKEGFFKALFAGIIILAMLSVNLGRAIYGSFGQPLNSPVNLLLFIAAMFLIGFTEETLFRGVICSLIAEKYAVDGAGVWFSVLVSGAVFGMAHVTNALSGIPLGAVFIQVCVAFLIGSLYSAFYLRSKNIWALIFIHAFNDFTALFETGVFGSGNIVTTVSSYSPIMYISLFSYTAMLFLALRNPVMRKITGQRELESGENSQKMLCVALIVICSVITCFMVISCIESMT